jgi:hypothetical protein
MNDLKRIAVVPNLGNPTNLSSVVTHPTEQMAGNQELNIFFALSRQDVQTWRQECKTWNYADHWWSRSSAGTGSAWEWNYTQQDLVSLAVAAPLYVVPAVWVRVQ